MSENYLGIIFWELSVGIIVWELWPSIWSCRKVKIYRDTGVSKNRQLDSYIVFVFCVIIHIDNITILYFQGSNDGKEEGSTLDQALNLIIETDEVTN